MRLGLFASVSLLVLAASGPVFAGFEFVAPSGSNSSSNAVAPSPSAPSIDNNDQALTPAAPIVPPAPIQSDALPEPVAAPERIINSRSDTPIAPVEVPLTPVVKDSDALAIETRPYSAQSKQASYTPPPAPVRNVVDNLAPSVSMPEPVPASSTIGNDGDVVQGFGRNVPLAIALQQIVPSSYRYSFEKPINPSQKISWSGGKPWKQIIADIARTSNMNVNIASNVISFSRQSPMDTIASDIDSSPDMVQGMKLKPVAGQRMASNDVTTSSASTAMPAPRSDIHDAIYDNPVAASSTSSTTTTSSKVTSSSSRQPLASISDEPLAAPTSILPPVPAATSPAPVASASAAGKSAFFDGLMDADTATNGAVKEKKIETADSSKPVDILDDVSVASPSPAQKQAQAMPAAMPKPVESTPMPSLPMPASAPVGAPTDITRQIDNTPVMSNDLPAPAMMQPAAVASAPENVSKSAGLATNQEWMAHKGETLRQTLTSWSEQAGVSLVWSSEYDYPLQTDVRIQANYADTVRTLLAGFSKAQPRPIGRLFKNDKVGAQPVLIVETQRLTN